jgi:uncharacterized membrane protein YheB (UPF0754 family)
MVQTTTMALTIITTGIINMKEYYILIVMLFFVTIGVFSQEHGNTTTEVKKEKLTIKEVDDFHTLLHPLVHDAYPANDYATIRTALPELVKSAKAIRSATLPKDFTSRKKFKQTSEKLFKELSGLNRKKDTMPDKEFGEQFMKMHDTFEKIMQIL